MIISMNENIKNCIVIIPAFNEEKSIGKVLSNLPKTQILKAIVVDNNSTDETALIAKKYGALVLKETRMGYGQACLTGIEKAYQFSPDIIAFLDGDFSDHPQDLTSILKKINEGFDLVIGSRTIGEREKGALLLQARFGNWLATRLMKILFKGYEFTDLGPFRAIKAQQLKRIKMKDRNFGWTVEMQIKSLLHQLKCTEVPVRYKKRIGVSKITGTVKGTFLAGYKILGLIGYYYLRSLILPTPSQNKRRDK